MSWLAKTVARFRGLRKRSVFISHASKDEELISAFVDLIEGIGLDSSTQIFYTSRIRQGVQPGASSAWQGIQGPPRHLRTTSWDSGLISLRLSIRELSVNNIEGFGGG